MNINSIHGGQAEPEAGYTGFPAPVVAHSARIVIDRRYLIEETPTAVRQEVVDLLELALSDVPGRDARDAGLDGRRPPRFRAGDHARLRALRQRDHASSSFRRASEVRQAVLCAFRA